MNIVISTFNISGKASLKMVVPDIKQKENRFYSISEEIHKFDIAKVVLSLGVKEYNVACDDMQEIVACLYGALFNVLHGKSQLPKNVNPANLGRYINIQLYDESWNEENETTHFSNDFNQYRVFAYKGLETWIYSSDHSLYMEFSYSYPRSFDENRRGKNRLEIDKKFYEYITLYRPLFFVEISHEVVQRWLKKCEKIIRKIDSEYVLDIK